MDEFANLVDKNRQDNKPVILQLDLKERTVNITNRIDKYSFSCVDTYSLIDPQISINYIHPDDNAIFLSFCDNLKKENSSFAMLRIKLKTNDYQLVMISAALMFDIDDLPKYLVITIVDVENAINLMDNNPNIEEKVVSYLLNKSFSFQIALAARDANPLKAIFLAAYDLETDDVIHFPGEVIPNELINMQKFSDIKKYYLEYVHNDDIKKIIYNELKLHKASINDSNKEEILLEGRIKLPSSKDNNYIWTQITFVKIIVSNRRRICCVIARDITEQKKNYDDLLHLASNDPFSTILPRMTFEEFCASQKSNRIKENQINAILLIEFISTKEKRLSGLKYIDFMDMIARKSEPVLSRHINYNTIISKFSNSMFLMSVHNQKSVNSIREIAYNLQDELISAINNEEVAVCIGIALCHHDKKVGFRCIYEDVEKALNIAKKYNDNRIVFYKEDMEYDSAVYGDKYVFIRTFSNFDIFVNDVPINFKYKKAKELLAILVDRKGGFVSNTEAASILWEDEPMSKQLRARFRKVSMWLSRILSEYGIKDIVEIDGRSRRLCTEKVNCDLYNYLSHKEKYADTYGGYYMNEYSWAEFTTAELNKELYIE